MEIIIDIKEEDFFTFQNKAKEIGIDAFEVIELIIQNNLAEKGLRSTIVCPDKPRNDLDYLFIDFEKKMKKHNILQSSIAGYLDTTQASISRALKSRKTNTLLFKQINDLHDKLLTYAYVYQNGQDIDLDEIGCKSYFPEESLPFIQTLAGKVEKNLGFKFSKFAFLSILCDFAETELFQKLNFKTLYTDIDEFVETINEIADNYFYEQHIPR